MFKRLAFLAFLALAMPASAEPLHPLAALQAMDGRVAAIGHRLALANRDICPRTMPLSGLLVHALEQYGRDMQPAAAALFGLTEEPAILAVVPGSAAARAGLQPGDAIAAIAGQAMPSPASQAHSYKRVRLVEEALLSALHHGPARIDYERDGAARSTVLERELGCVSRVQLIPSSRLNASADGTYAQVTSGIVEFANNEDELALVIAHEMAHNILEHRIRLDQQKVSRGIFAAIDGSAPKIKATEVEADRYALYLLANAGYDIDAAPAFWDRYGRKMGFGIFSDGTHPGRSSRVADAEATIGEIRQRQRPGETVAPALALTGN